MITKFTWDEKLSKILWRINDLVDQFDSMSSALETLRITTASGLAAFSSALANLSNRVMTNEASLQSYGYRLDQLEEQIYIKVVRELSDLPSPSFYPLVYSYGDGPEPEGLFIREPNGKYKEARSGGRTYTV